MQITNHTKRLIRVADLYIARGRTAQVPDEEFRAWAATPEGRRLQSAIVVTNDPPQHGELLRRHMLSGVVMVMTSDGRPRCDALSRAMGRTVTGDERDRVWAQTKANYIAASL